MTPWPTRQTRFTMSTRYDNQVSQDNRPISPASIVTTRLYMTWLAIKTSPTKPTKTSRSSMTTKYENRVYNDN